MIKIMDGDLLESSAVIIAHQVNCQGAFNSGVAKQVREKYPEVYIAYKNLCDAYSDCKEQRLLGRCQMVWTHKRNYIVNLFGQLNYGYDGEQYTDTDALKSAMTDLRNTINPEGKTIAFPYGLGSVRGGAKWEDVYKIIEEVFDGYNVEIWRLDKG